MILLANYLFMINNVKRSIVIKEIVIIIMFWFLINAVIYIWENEV